MRATISLDLTKFEGDRFDRSDEIEFALREATRAAARNRPAYRSLFNRDGEPVGFALVFDPEAAGEPYDYEVPDSIAGQEILPPGANELPDLDKT